jgi:hypothetical protein
MFYTQTKVETFLSRFLDKKRESRAIKARFEKYSDRWGSLPAEKLEVVLGSPVLADHFFWADDEGLLDCSRAQFKKSEA